MKSVEPKVILVLGAKLGENDMPTEEMKIRVNTAANVFKQLEAQGKSCPIIACGGITSGCKTAEADVMEKLLIMQGVPAAWIKKDVKSRNTMENMQCAILEGDIKKGQRVCIVTSDYHSFRAVQTAKRAGINAYGVKARLKHDKGWFKAWIKEPIYTIDLLFDWQDRGVKRPEAMSRLINRVSKW